MTPVYTQCCCAPWDPRRSGKQEKERIHDKGRDYGDKEHNSNYKFSVPFDLKVSKLPC